MYISKYLCVLARKPYIYIYMYICGRDIHIKVNTIPQEPSLSLSLPPPPLSLPVFLKFKHHTYICQ